MITHNLRVTGQRILGTQRVLIASNASQSIKLRFDFDCEWDAFENKEAIFGRENEEPLVIDIINSEVIIPWEILTKAEPFFLSVMGYNESMLLTAKKEVIEVADSFIPDDLKKSDPSKNLFDRVTGELEQKYQTIISSLESQNNSKQMQIDLINEQLQSANNEIQALTDENELKQNEISALTQQCLELYDKASTADAWDEYWQGVNNLNGMFASTLFLRESGATLPPIDTVNVSDASNALGNDNFGSCIETFSMKCDKVTTLEGFAANSTALKYVTLDNIGTKLKNIKKSFYNCSSLISINGVIDMTNVLYASDAFTGCSGLQTVSLKENTAKVSLDFSSCESLSYETLVSVLNSLSPNATGKTLKLHENAISTLTVGGFTYESNGTQYSGKEAYYRAVTEKNWVFIGWTI